MINWKSTLNKKKIQRHINKKVRELNKSIEKDDLWLGRFYCHQKSIRFVISDDHTRLCARVEIEFVDRKTGKFISHYFYKEDFMGVNWKLFEAMNNFIIEDCKVWNEVPRPSIVKPWDYRKER